MKRNHPWKIAIFPDTAGFLAREHFAESHAKIGFRAKWAVVFWHQAK